MIRDAPLTLAKLVADSNQIPANTHFATSTPKSKFFSRPAAADRRGQGGQPGQAGRRGGLGEFGRAAYPFYQKSRRFLKTGQTLFPMGQSRLLTN